MPFSASSSPQWAEWRATRRRPTRWPLRSTSLSRTSALWRVSALLISSGMRTPISERDSSARRSFADALCTTGHTESAYGILLQTTCPSFLYPVTMGATTMWERWDALLPDGSVNPGKMTSFNHYTFGAIADWLHRTVAGLAPGSPGYRRIDVRPQPGGHLNSASATHDTPYGTAAVAWERHRRRFHLSVDVPTGSVADILLPDGTARGVGPGSHSFVCEFRAPEDDPEEEPSKLDRWLDPA